MIIFKTALFYTIYKIHVTNLARIHYLTNQFIIFMDSESFSVFYNFIQGY